jgi:hypothetical protein
MKGHNMKVKVKKSFPNMKDVLPEGFETTLSVELTDDDVEITRKYKDKQGNVIPAQIRPKGSYKRFIFTGVNGGTYDDFWIIQRIGYTPIDEIFEKI